MATTRYTLDLDQGLDKTLTDLAESKSTSKAEIIKRALATYKYISGETSSQSGKKVSITDGTDTVLKDIVIP